MSIESSLPSSSSPLGSIEPLLARVPRPGREDSASLDGRLPLTPRPPRCPFADAGDDRGSWRLLVLARKG